MKRIIYHIEHCKSSSFFKLTLLTKFGGKRCCSQVTSGAKAYCSKYLVNICVLVQMTSCGSSSYRDCSLGHPFPADGIIRSVEPLQMTAEKK